MKPPDDDRAERLDDEDRAMLGRLGYAVARAQLFEFAMLMLIEAQRHDLTVPLDERWAEIETWLTKWTAGRAANELRIPEEIAADLRAVVRRRNVVVHHSWRFYLDRRAKLGGAAIVGYIEWFDEQAAVMGHAYNGVMTIVFGLGEDANPPDDAELAKLWRGCVPAPIEDVSVPELGADSSTSAR